MAEPNTMAAILAEGNAAAAALGQPAADQGINNMALAFEKSRAEMIAVPEPPKEPEPEPEPVVEVVKEPEATKEPEAAKEPPKADAPSKEEAAPEPKGRTRENFKRLESEKVELSKRAEAAEIRLKEIKSRKLEDSPEFARLREENERYSKQLEITNVTSHPRFVAYFDGKTKAVLAQAEQYFGKEQAPKIMEILDAPPSRQRNQALGELLPDLDDMDRQQLGAIAQESDKIKLERRSEVERAGVLAQQMKERQAVEAENYRKHLESRFDQALAESRKTYRLFQPKEGDDEWNQRIPELEARAKKIFSGLNTPEEAAQASMLAAMAPRQIEFIAVQDSYIKKLEAQIESMQKAIPTIPTNGKPVSNGKPKEMGFVEMATGLMRGDIPMPAKTR